MQKFKIEGMSCAACVARVEKAVKKLEGVSSCEVSLLTNSMRVEGDVSAESIASAVSSAGYKAISENEKKSEKAESQSEDKGEISALKKRFISSVAILIPLMYVSMGYAMWGFPMPSFFEGNGIAVGILELLLTGIIMVINQKFFESGFKSLIHLSPNMDALVSIGSGASFLYSVYVLFSMTAAPHAEGHMHDFYFESAAMILTLITMGKMLEAYSKGKTANALKALMSLTPKTANVLRDGAEVKISADEVKIDDIFIVRQGDNVPVDGVVIEGEGAIDESVLTGESIPAEKEIKSSVSAATTCESGFLKCRAVKVGEDTTLSQIIKMMNDAAATKAPIAKAADKVSGVFVPIVMAIAVVTAVVWLLLGQSAGFALTRGVSVLVISCPCALGLATPVAIMVGNGVGARRGILFKTARSLEVTGKTKIIALDKTGTVTKGEPRVTDVFTFEKDEKSVLKAACSLEKLSNHPLAKAIVLKAEEENAGFDVVKNFKTFSGNGLSAEINGNRLLAGSKKFISQSARISDEAESLSNRLSDEGKTPVFIAENEAVIGIIAIADEIKEESAEAVRELKKMGLRVVMLTGDNEKTARAIAKQAGIDEVVAGVLPDGKESKIAELKNSGRVAMVGDGVNDAPALARADVGMAIGAGTDVAIESADVVLIKSRLSDIPTAVKLSRATLRNIHENLFWAFIYNTIGIPLAAGVFIPLFGWELNPMFGAAAMSLSSFCVVTNALRLNFFGRHNNNKKEKKSMKKTVTIKIEGMMCPHCEATVKNTLEEFAEVESANPSHKTATAEVVLNGEIDLEKLYKAVEEKGYKVIRK